MFCFPYNRSSLTKYFLKQHFPYLLSEVNVGASLLIASTHDVTNLLYIFAPFFDRVYFFKYDNLLFWAIEAKMATCRVHVEDFDHSDFRRLSLMCNEGSSTLRYSFSKFRWMSFVTKITSVTLIAHLREIWYR